jgi:hypothetical protein
MVIFIDHTSPLFFTVFIEGLTGAVFLTLILLAFKKSRPSYALYALLAYIAPTLTGTFLSMPRFTLVLFPAYIVLAKLIIGLPPRFKKAIYAASLTAAIIASSLFVRGYFVG